MRGPLMPGLPSAMRLSTSWTSPANKASERGQFGGIVSGSVDDVLWKRIHS